MSDIVMKVEDLSKIYRLGEIGTGTLSDDLKRWIYKIRGKEDPFTRLGETNVRSSSGSSNYVWALKNVSFEVPQGEVLGIIGKNGAGKSTLLKILSKITAPTEGNIRIKGRFASLLEVGTGFHPELTGRENIYLNGAILGMNKQEINAKLDEIVDFSGIERYLDTPVKRYSSGMKVRLGFAVAAHLDPEILIIDEVLAVGDAEFQSKAIGKMKKISEGGGRTVLFVSHNLGSVSSLCSRCLYIKDGMIASAGKTDLIIQNYLEDVAEENDNNDLLTATSRKGSGVIKASKLTMLNPNSGHPITGLIAGQPIEFHLGYHSELKKIEDLEVAIIINNQLGNFTTVFNNSMANFNFKNVPGKGTLICKIPRVALMSGKFYVNVNIAHNKIVTDRLENAMTFTVNEGDYFNSGYPNSRNRQGVYIDHTWDISI